MENAVLFLWDSWTVLGRVVALLAIIVFVLGCESIAIKLAADFLRWRHRRSEPTIEMIVRKREDRAAILIPITGPAPLAGAMLARIGLTLDYENYVIFVGVRTHDEQTLAAVQCAARRDSKVQLCLLEPGDAVSEGRVLNAMFAAARQFEHAHDADFRTYFLQGAETAIHPLTLKLVNWHSELASVVQLPLLTAPRISLPTILGGGIDDLGEQRARELQLRSRVVHHLPVGNVGLALRRDALWTLRHRGEVFDTRSESPVFDAVRRLNERGHLSTFVWQHDRQGRVIAAEALAPRTYGEAVGAKAARLSSRALSGWQPLPGNQGGLWAQYFNYRDRRIVPVAATLGFVALTALAAGALLLAGQATPGFESTPGLIEATWVFALLATNAALAVAALVERVILTAKTRGFVAATILPVSLAASALVTTHAVLRASRTSKGKRNENCDPEKGSAKPSRPGSALTLGKTRITDILVHSGALTPEDAKAAHAYTSRTGRRLSLALQDLRLANPATIAKALGEKLGLEFAHLDGPLDSHNPVFLSRHEAERFSAFAQRARDGGVDVYVGEDYSPREWRALRAALRRAGVFRPCFKIAPLGEIAYAIRFAGTAQEMAIEQAIAVSLMDGPIIEGTDRNIRRQLRGPYRRLEDMLVERGLIAPRRMRMVRQRIGVEGPGLEESVCRDRRMPPFTLAQTVREFNEWRPAIALPTSPAPIARCNARRRMPVDPRLAA
jgi:hypothetical protein